MESVESNQEVSAVGVAAAWEMCADRVVASSLLIVFSFFLGKERRQRKDPEMIPPGGRGDGGGGAGGAGAQGGCGQVAELNVGEQFGHDDGGGAARCRVRRHGRRDQGPASEKEERGGYQRCT